MSRRPSRRDALKWAAALPFAPAAFAQKPKPKDEFPITGVADDRLKPLDDLFAGHIIRNGLPGAAVAVSRHGRLVYARGFGYANVEKKLPVQPTALFRLASVSKPITAVAVLQLVEKKLIKLDAPILDYVSVKPFLEPKAKVDPRWKKVTVRHCLQQTGGWDRDLSLDPCTDTWAVAKALGTTPPLTPEQVTRYALGRPLDFDPGERYCYANQSYLLLGRAIEKVTQGRYEEYVRKRVFGPLKIAAPRLARGTPPNRPKVEVSYYDAKGETSTSLYPPTAGQVVPTPDGGLNVEGFEAHGGWVASAVDLVKFTTAFDDPAKCPLLSEGSVREMWARPDGAAGSNRGRPTETYYGCGWSVRPIGNAGKVNAWHYGLISGTSTVIVRRNDGFAWAVLFNTDRIKGTKTEAAGGVAEQIHTAVDAVTDWPDTDQFEKLLK